MKFPPARPSLCHLQMVNNTDKGNNDGGGYKVSAKDRGLKSFSLQTAILMGTNYCRGGVWGGGGEHKEAFCAEMLT